MKLEDRKLLINFILMILLFFILILLIVVLKMFKNDIQMCVENPITYYEQLQNVSCYCTDSFVK